MQVYDVNSLNIEEIYDTLADRWPQWDPVLSRIELKDDPTVRVARNDGRSIYINTRSMRGYSREAQCFFFARELLQIQLMHDARRGSRDERLWKKACDAVTNRMLVADGFEPPADVDIDAGADDISAEDYYLTLDPDAEDEDEAPDDNELPEIAAVEKKEKSDKAGKDSDAQERIIEDPDLSRAIANLADLLEPSMQLDFDWFPGDTIRDGVIRERLLPYSVPHAELLLDTSASIDSDLLRTFVSQVKGLLRRDAVVKVGCFDTRFYGFTQVTTDEDIDALEIRGAGGTDFEAAVGAFTGDAETRIIFTDGCAPMPSGRHDVIWLVYGDVPIHPKGGRVIYVKKPKEIVENEITFLIT